MNFETSYRNKKYFGLIFGIIMMILNVRINTTVQLIFSD